MSNLHLKKGILNRVPFLFFTILSFTLLLSSCASTPNVMSFILPEGKQQYFISKTNFREKEINIDVDLTIHVLDSKIYDSVVLNYTLNRNENSSSSPDFILCYDSSTYYLKDVKKVFTDINTNSVRFTSNIDADVFRDIIYASSIYITAKKEDGSNVKLYSKELEKTIQKLRDVIE